MAANKFCITRRIIDNKTQQGIHGLRVETWYKVLIIDYFIGRPSRMSRERSILEPIRNKPQLQESKR